VPISVEAILGVTAYSRFKEIVPLRSCSILL
jgi:hypothetical protein